jgi:hypothetical protein
VGHHPRAERVEGLQVGARAEGDIARPGEDEHARLVVGDEALIPGGQRIGGWPVDGVAALGPVDGEHGGGAGALVADGIGHGGERYRS